MDRIAGVRTQAAQCIAALGACPRSDSAKFFRWLFQTLNVADKELQPFYMQTLLECIELTAPDTLQGVGALLVVNTKTLLEAVQESDTLAPVLPVLEQLATRCPRQFGQHFKEIADMLIDWRADSSLPEETGSTILRVLDGFGDHWSANASYSAELLVKFLTDMEAVASDVRTPQQQRLAQLTGHSRAFEAVGKRLTTVLAGDGARMMIRLIAVFRHARDVPVPAWAAEGNRLLGALAPALRGGFVGAYLPALEFLLSQLSPSATGAAMRDALAQHAMIVRHLGGSFPLNGMHALLAASSPIRRLRTHSDATVVSRVLDLHALLLRHPSAALAQAAFALIETDLVTLRGSMSNPPDASIETADAGTQDGSDPLTPGAMEASALFCLACLHCLPPPGGREAIVAMYARLWALVMQYYHPVSDELVPHKPQLLAGIMGLMHKAWIRTHSPRLAPFAPWSVDAVRPLALSVLEAAARHEDMATVSIVCATWLDEMTAVPAPWPDNAVRSTATVLLKIATFKPVALRRAALTCLQHAVERLAVPSDLAAAAAEVALFCASDVRPEAEALLRSAAPPAVLGAAHGGSETSPIAAAMLDWKHHVLGTSPTSSLRPPVFARYMAYLAQTTNEPAPRAWLTRAFRAVMGQLPPPPHDASLTRGTDVMEAFWGPWEAARFCIASRLYTPFGTPMDTFKALEHMLTEYVAGAANAVSQTASAMSQAAMVANRSSDSEGDDDDPFARDDDDEREAPPPRRVERAPPRPPKPLQRRPAPLRALVEFGDCLEKHIFNAHEGSLSLAQPVKQRPFFRTNKKTCEDWYMRVREPLVSASVICGAAAPIIRHASQRLRDLEILLMLGSKDQARVVSDVEDTLATFGTALCHIGDTSTLEGLVAWVKQLNTRVKLPAELVLPCAGALLHQAQGRYEQAAAEYAAYLQSGPSGSAARAGVSLASARMAECYANLGDAKSMEEWSTQLRRLRVQAGADDGNDTKHISGPELNYLQALAAFDAGDMAGARRKVDAVMLPDLERVPSAAPYAARVLMLRALCAPPGGAGTSQDLDRAAAILAEPLRMAVGGFDRERHSLLILAHCVHVLRAAGTTAGAASAEERARSLRALLMEIVPGAQHDAAWWGDLARAYGAVLGGDGGDGLLDTLCLRAAAAARVTKNATLAERWLNALGNSRDMSLEVAFERAQLLHSAELHTEAAASLWALTRALAGGGDLGSQSVGETPAAWLTLASYLQRGRGKIDIARLRGAAPMLFADQGASEDEDLVLDHAAGTCLAEAAAVFPDSAIARFRYAAWCYRQGHRDIESLQAAGSIALLTPQESDQVAAIVAGAARLAPRIEPSDVSRAVDDLRAALAAFGEARAASGGSLHSLQEEGAREATAVCPWLPPSAASAFGALWAAVRGRVLHFYQAAASSYFAFLAAPAETGERPGSRDTITATLRVLRLLVKHGTDLAPALTPGLRETPTGPWEEVIPQLMARTGHVAPYIRDSVLELLTRVSATSPHVLVYPTVERAASSNADNARQVGPIHHALVAQNADMVRDVTELIRELQRIAVLWEERWVTALTQLDAEVAVRTKKIAADLAQLQANADLPETQKQTMIAERYEAITRPVLVTLDALHRETSRSPETPHETHFHQAYLPTLVRAIENFRSPADPSDPAAAWAPLKRLTGELAKCQPRGRIALANVSPVLARQRISLACLPGVRLPRADGTAARDSSDAGFVPPLSALEGAGAVLSFLPDILVLATKTRPKKLTLRSSTGETYSYLLKGREDLHLDERIMQFLGVVNQCLRRADTPYAPIASFGAADDDRVGTGGIGAGLRARNFAVVPLGESSGLLQWVDGAVPLFALFKRWQTRMWAAQQPVPKGGTAPTEEDEQRPPPRPSELYYAKLAPLLKSKCIDMSARKRWPPHILRRVLRELKAATPGDLVAKELWCSSVSTADWWSKQQTYSRSVAVMSMVGYVLGLGDRHLDNILADFTTGEVVHIDYNVCFEKGLRLRVPETVPFRLTQNIEQALGFTGVDGTFRNACEQVMRVMRRSKETLLTLLEAFVYDPLLDWTANREADTARRSMELSVSLTLLASRLAESEAPLTASYAALASLLGRVSGALDEVAGARTQRGVASAAVAGLEDELGALNALIEEMRTSGDAARASLDAAPTAAEMVSFSARIEATRHECASWQEVHGQAVETVQGAWLPSLLRDITSAEAPPVLWSLPNPANARFGPEHLERLARAEAAHRALWGQLVATLRGVVEVLLAYRNAVLQLPREYPAENRRARWASRLQLVRATGNSATVDAVLAEAAASTGLMRAQADRLRDGILQQEIIAGQALLARAQSAPALAVPAATAAEAQHAAQAFLASLRKPGSEDWAATCCELAILRLFAEVLDFIQPDVVAALAGIAPRPGAEERVAAAVEQAGAVIGALRELWGARVPAHASPAADAIAWAAAALAASRDLEVKAASVVLPDALSAVHSDDVTVREALAALSQSAATIRPLLAQVLAARHVLAEARAADDLARVNEASRALANLEAALSSHAAPFDALVSGASTGIGILLAATHTLFAAPDQAARALAESLAAMGSPVDTKGYSAWAERAVAMDAVFAASALPDAGTAVPQIVATHAARHTAVALAPLLSAALTHFVSVRLVARRAPDRGPLGARVDQLLEGHPRMRDVVICVDHLRALSAARARQTAVDRVTEADAALRARRVYLAQFQWLEGASLALAEETPGLSSVPAPDLSPAATFSLRAKLLDDMRVGCGALRQLSERAMRERGALEAAEAAAIADAGRQPWPALGDLDQPIHAAAKTRARRDDRAAEIAAAAAALCASLLGFETMRDASAESEAFDASTATLLAQYAAALRYLENHRTELEQAAVVLETNEERSVLLATRRAEVEECVRAHGTSEHHAGQVANKREVASRIATELAKWLDADGKALVETDALAATVLRGIGAGSAGDRTRELRDAVNEFVEQRRNIAALRAVVDALAPGPSVLTDASAAQQATKDEQARGLLQRGVTAASRVASLLVSLRDAALVHVRKLDSGGEAPDAGAPGEEFAAENEGVDEGDGLDAAAADDAREDDSDESSSEASPPEADERAVRVDASPPAAPGIAGGVERASADSADDGEEPEMPAIEGERVGGVAPGKGEARPGQERNARGLAVLKGVRLKLDGRDRAAERRSTVAEQVDWVIEQARSEERLALLYEGWTAWI